MAKDCESASMKSTFRGALDPRSPFDRAISNIGVTKIATHDLHGLWSGFRNGECQVSSAGTGVKYGMPLVQLKTLNRPRAPVPVRVERQQMIHQVVPWCDLAKHLSYSRLTLVECLFGGVVRRIEDSRLDLWGR